MLDIGTFGSNFITIARERKVDNFSTLLPKLLISLARAWNKPRIFIGLSAKQGRHSQQFMVLLRTFTLLTHQLYPSVSKLTCYTGGRTNSSTGANETPTRSLDGASRGFMSTPGKRKACDPSGSANNGKRVKISAADLPESQNSRRLACPFSKHNPARYRDVHSACTVPPGFLDVKSFMEHLKRCHAPLRCQTCKIRFLGSATNALRARDAARIRAVTLGSNFTAQIFCQVRFCRCKTSGFELVFSVVDLNKPRRRNSALLKS
ncbi:uncharacterized protein K441DRAFT_359658 [Cenococcum geophilum 1.58]|uniref:Uncharacterized protein n=1 Tax=Cenococcum geophilum 1.58 TaxID=794803 RepID=A0ACC8ENS9_9PEZI|nr:hypothetical protein K441DRAFT_359658 [Cenococcum geophilum 1.58]